MDSSWRDGLAFCALIHHFRPQLIQFSSLTGEDMLDTEVPDKFSIITYVSQFYHLLKDEDNSRSPSLPVREVREVSGGQNSGEASPQGTPKSVPRSVFLSSNPILRNNKFCPNIKVTGDTVNALCED